MLDKINKIAKEVIPVYGLSSMVAEKVIKSSLVTNEILKAGDAVKIKQELERSQHVKNVQFINKKTGHFLYVCRNIYK